MMNFTPEEVEQARAQAEVASVGPCSSALLIPSEIFLGVNWNDDLERVKQAVINGEEIDVGTQWSIFKQDEGVHMALWIDWPDTESQIVLYFNGGQWDVELQAIHSRGAVFIHPEGIKGAEKLEGALGIEVPREDDDLLAVYLAHQAEKRASQDAE